MFAMKTIRAHRTSATVCAQAPRVRPQAAAGPRRPAPSVQTKAVALGKQQAGSHIEARPTTTMLHETVEMMMELESLEFNFAHRPIPHLGKIELWHDPATDAVAGIQVGDSNTSYDIMIGHQGTRKDKQWQLNATAVLFPAPPATKPTDSDSFIEESESHPPGSVHLGFLTHFIGLREQVLDRVDELLARNPKKKPVILVTGHSLGGGTATVSASSIAMRYPNADIRLVVYGAPRAGNRAYTESVLRHENIKGYWRVVFGEDIVPRVPWDWGFGGYRHMTGDWLHLEHPDDGETKWKGTVNLLDRAQDAALWLKKGASSNLDPFGDHSFRDKYYPEMMRFIGKTPTWPREDKKAKELVSAGAAGAKE